MSLFFIVIYAIICVALITLVLLQSGKEGMGVIFGGGSDSVFGSTGAGGLIVKLTSILGALFLATALLSNVLSSPVKKSAPSIMQDVKIEDVVPAPATPVAPAAPQAPAESGK